MYMKTYFLIFSEFRLILFEGIVQNWGEKLISIFNLANMIFFLFHVVVFETEVTIGYIFY